MPEKIHIDIEQPIFRRGAVGLIITDDNGKSCDIVYAGKSYLTMPVSLKKEEKVYQILEDELDICFLFDDRVPEYHFYPIPSLYIFATDSIGGCIGSTKHPSFSEEDTPIYYVLSDAAYYIAPNLKEFLSIAIYFPDWRKRIGVSYSQKEIISEETKKYLIQTLTLSLNEGNLCFDEEHFLKDQDLQIYRTFDDAKNNMEFYDISDLESISRNPVDNTSG